MTAKPKPPRFTPERTLPPDTQFLPIDHIVAGQELQMRVHLDAQTVAEYVEWLDQLQFRPNGLEAMPRIVVFSDGQRIRHTPTGPLEVVYWLADGFHRLEAWKALRHKIPNRIQAQVLPGGRREAILYAAGANAEHGLRRTTQDKRRAVETLLRDNEWARWSDNEIAKRCHVSDHFVTKIRRELSSIQSKIETTRTVQRGGTTYEMKTEKIGKPAPITRVPDPDYVDTPIDDLESAEAPSENRAEVKLPEAVREEKVDSRRGKIWGYLPKELEDAGWVVYVQHGLDKPFYAANRSIPAATAYHATLKEVAGDVTMLARIAKKGRERAERETGEPLTGGAPMPPPPGMREFMAAWLAEQGGIEVQRRVALNLAELGYRSDYWPALNEAWPDGVGCVPDQVKLVAGDILAALNAPPADASEIGEEINQPEVEAEQQAAAPITLRLTVDQVRWLYRCVEHTLLYTAERHEMLGILAAALPDGEA